VQVSFTLPVPFGSEEERARAEGAALQLATAMGLEPAMVVHAKGMGQDFTFFIVYGRVSHLVDLSQVTVVPREFPLLSSAEVNLRIRGGLGRKLVVLGACIGTDAHTVGIDAILNVKGHAGEKGLEYYREMRVVNLGAQVDVDKLVARTRAERADAVLVSQVVSQREAHLAGAREVSAGPRTRGSGRRCSWWAVPGSIRPWPRTWAWTRSSGAAQPPVRSPVTWCTPWPRRDRRRGPGRHAPPVRAGQPRPLRREPGRRRVRARLVR
jgi:beta-lysine 5,6-aminomutase beta subunit